MNMKYMRAGWVNNMDSKATYRWICHLVRLYKRAWATLPADNSARYTYTRMLTGWLINEPEITIAALSAGKGE